MKPRKRHYSRYDQLFFIQTIKSYVILLLYTRGCFVHAKIKLCWSTIKRVSIFVNMYISKVFYSLFFDQLDFSNLFDDGNMTSLYIYTQSIYPFTMILLVLPIKTTSFIVNTTSRWINFWCFLSNAIDKISFYMYWNTHTFCCTIL